MAISKVIYGNQTLIDITDTDATATTVQAGRKFYNGAGEAVTGIGSALGHETEVLANGGIAHYITGVDLGGDTVDASHLYSGYTAHGEDGSVITGTMTGAPLKMGVIRPDATLVKTFGYDKWIHADEGITIPAYSTSVTTLKATGALTETYTCDYTTYNYYILIRTLSYPTYSLSTHAKGRVEYNINSTMYEVAEVPANTFAAILDPTVKYASANASIVATSAFSRLVYWSGSSAISPYSTTSYGVPETIVAPTLSSGVITFNTPNLTARGHTTYFVKTYMNAVTDIRYQWKIEVYRAPKSLTGINGWGQTSMMMHNVDCALSSSHTLT